MRSVRTASLVPVLAVALVGALASWAGAADGGKTFADTVGDPGTVTGTGSDVASVKVSHDARTVTFQVTTVKPLVELHSLVVVIDSDRNGSTGDTTFDVVSRVGGFEWQLSFSNGNNQPTQSTFKAWDGKAWANRSFVGVVYRRIAPATVEFVVPRSAIGDPTAFDFVVRAVSVGTYYAERVDVDSAPDSGTWTYTLAAAQRLALGKAKVSPVRPKAGSTATVRAALSAPGGTATARCSARVVGGAALKAAAAVAGKSVVCKVKLPSSARNVKVSGTVGVTAGASSSSARFAFATAA